MWQGLKEIFVKCLEQDVAHNKKFSKYYYQLPSIIWYICGISYLANSLVLEVLVVSNSHYYKRCHNQDYSLRFNIMTSFLLSSIAQHLEIYKKTILTSVRVG